MRLTDTHCHLYLQEFEEDLPSVLERSHQAGVEFLMVPGIDLETSQAAIRLAEQHENVFAAVGFHPNNLAHWGIESVDGLHRLARHPRVLAIGEIGLDYYRNTFDRDVQISAFRQQLELAAELDLPVILHNRQASDDLYPMILDWQQLLTGTHKVHASQPGVLHAFTQDHPLIPKLIEANFFFGIGGPVTFTNNKILPSLLPSIPINRVLLETDAPYLTPHPFRGQRNEPAHVQLIASKIASLYATELTNLTEKTCDNAARLFSWRSEH